MILKRKWAFVITKAHIQTAIVTTSQRKVLAKSERLQVPAISLSTFYADIVKAVSSTKKSTSQREEPRNQPPPKKSRQRATEGDLGEPLERQGQRADFDPNDGVEDQRLLGRSTLLFRCTTTPRNQFLLRLLACILLTVLPVILVLLFYKSAASGASPDDSKLQSRTQNHAQSVQTQSLESDWEAAMSVSLASIFIMWTVSLFNALVQEVRRPVVMACACMLALLSGSVFVMRVTGPSAPEPVKAHFLPIPNLGHCQFISEVRSLMSLCFSS